MARFATARWIFIDDADPERPYGQVSRLMWIGMATGIWIYWWAKTATGLPILRMLGRRGSRSLWGR